MRDRKIVRVVDARRAQRRITLWLVCGHVLSIDQRTWEAAPADQLPTVGGVVQCSFCPDPPPDDVRTEKSAQALWREAGEP